MNVFEFFFWVGWDVFICLALATSIYFVFEYFGVLHYLLRKYAVWKHHRICNKEKEK